MSILKAILKTLVILFPILIIVGFLTLLDFGSSFVLIFISIFFMLFNIFQFVKTLYIQYDVLGGFILKYVEIFLERVGKLYVSWVDFYAAWLKNIFSLIIKNSPFITKIIQFLLPKWYELFPNYILLIHIFCYLPTVLVSLSFFFDVVILKSLVFFPIAVLLLLLPIILQIFVFFCWYMVRYYEESLVKIFGIIIFEVNGILKIVMKKEFYTEIPILKESIPLSPQELDKVGYIIRRAIVYEICNTRITFFFRSLVAFKGKIYYYIINSILWFISFFTIIFYY